ncbi:LysR family transcriptional regulator [Cupriavidus sp. UME77]|uniref:helix-turn-helix domain-containing protein n=1 Tax=Cupriavidus sp. UME77 TaxID=1862321 RepID=UPI0016013125|nr:LysR family transcriptional regulator [Cupriavidus sp. UME77]
MSLLPSNPTVSLCDVMPRRLKLKSMRTFDRALQSDSIVRAGRKLSLRQSAITKAIQELVVDRVRAAAWARTAIAVPSPTLGSLLLGVQCDSVVAMRLRGKIDNYRHSILVVIFERMIGGVDS